MKHLLTILTAFCVVSCSQNNTTEANKPSQQTEQQQVQPTSSIEIWEGNIPGAIKNDAIKLEEGKQGWVYMRNITTPMLDYYPAEGENNTAVVICPGGGYWALTIKAEGYDIAQWLNSIGISAFLLKYRLPSDSIMEDRKIGPLIDAQQAIRYVRSHAAELKVDPNKIGIMGFSAGGHVASTASTHFNDSLYAPKYNVSARPDFSLLIYPVITMDPALTHADSRKFLIGADADAELTNKFSSDKQVTPNTPPAFLAHATDDKLVPFENSVLYTQAMRNNGVHCELHLYGMGDHGFFAGWGKATAAQWRSDCARWLKMQELIK